MSLPVAAGAGDGGRAAAGGPAVPGPGAPSPSSCSWPGTFAALLVPRFLGELVDVVVDRRSRSDLDGTVLALLGAGVAQGVLAGAGLLLVGSRWASACWPRCGSRSSTGPWRCRWPTSRPGGTGDLVARVVGDVDAVSRPPAPPSPRSSPRPGHRPDRRRPGHPRLAPGPGRPARRARPGRDHPLVPAPLGPIYAAERAAEGRRSEQLHASVAGARVLRALRRHDDHIGRIERAVDRGRRPRRLAPPASAPASSPGLNGAELLGLGSILVMGFVLVRDDVVTIGMATAGALYFHRLFDPVNVLLSQLDTAQAAGAAMARLVGVASMTRPRRRRRPRRRPTARSSSTACRSRYDADDDDGAATASTCGSPPASGSPWSGPAGPARRRSPSWSPACTAADRRVGAGRRHGGAGDPGGPRLRRDGGRRPAPRRPVGVGRRAEGRPRPGRGHGVGRGAARRVRHRRRRRRPRPRRHRGPAAGPGPAGADRPRHRHPRRGHRRSRQRRGPAARGVGGRRPSRAGRR